MLGKLDLSNVTLLSNNWQQKSISLLATLKSEDHPEGADAVLLVSRQGFDDAEGVVRLIQNGLDRVRLILTAHNDIYYYYQLSDEEGSGNSEAIVCRLTVIYPATKRHVQKYTQQERRIVLETPRMYEEITASFIERNVPVDWVLNIVQVKSVPETETAYYETNDFVILADSKWDRVSLSSLYLLAITRSDDLRSLRDLSIENLPLLKDILTSSQRVVKEQFGLDASQLRIFLHYQPTYYHLHVHIVHVDYEMPGCSVGAAHLLTDVIDNIENICSYYYQMRTLPCTLGVDQELYQLFQGKL